MFDFKKYNDYELLYLYNIHSEEALSILLEKYSHLIDIKLCAFHIKSHQLDDFKQECMLSLMHAINSFSDTYNKTFYRYAELIIDRKIMNLLRSEYYYSKHLVFLEDFNDFNSDVDVEKNSIYKKTIDEITKIKMIGIKEDILKEVLFEGISIKDFSLKHNIGRKDVYNHLYLIREKLKKDLL